MRYRWQTGAMAWLIHRITGAVVGLYLLLHILGQFGMKYGGLEGLRNFISGKAVVVVLMACLIYHTLNGVRELIIDFGSGALYHQKLFWAMMIIGVLIYVTTLAVL